MSSEEIILVLVLVILILLIINWAQYHRNDTLNVLYDALLRKSNLRRDESKAIKELSEE